MSLKPPPASTFASLRALQLIIADALDDIQRVFSQCGFPEDTQPLCSAHVFPFSQDPSLTSQAPLKSTCPPETHFAAQAGVPFVDYPSPDLLMVPNSLSEQLALHPDAAAAASRIVAACGQISNIVHKPFSSLCDAMMGYNIPACMRFVEHLHVAEVLREAEENKQRDHRTGTDRIRPEGFRIENGSEGLHVTEIANVICSYAGVNYVDPNNLAHALRLLSTHYIFRETAPDTFSLTRVASLLDSGNSVSAVFANPDSKYDGAGGISAYVGLITDELFKSAAYLTEAWTGVRLPSPTSNSSRGTDTPSHGTGSSLEPLGKDVLTLLSSQSPATVPSAYPDLEKGHRHSAEAKSDNISAFNLAIRTRASFFDWLESGSEDPLGGTGQGACTRDLARTIKPGSCGSPKLIRLNRLSKGMIGTTMLEAPNAILNGFDWYSLPKGSTVVDVGGGIGTTTMILASALNHHSADLMVGDGPRTGSGGLQPTPVTVPRSHKLSRNPLLVLNNEPGNNTAANSDMGLHFVVQDKPSVSMLGVELWRSKHLDMLESGQVTFQGHDFFEPQPSLGPPHLTRHPAVYLLRCILHSWPDEPARRILLNLRVASNPETRLVIAEHVLLHACVDGRVLGRAKAGTPEGIDTREWSVDTVLASVEGAKEALAPPPLLSNLGKASANAYLLDLIMHVLFNGKVRTLREFCALALSAGWRVVRVTQPKGTLFAYLVCEPTALPDEAKAIHDAVTQAPPLSH